MGASGRLITTVDIKDATILAADIAPGATLAKLGEVAGSGASGVLEISSIPATSRSLEIHLIGRADVAGTTTGVRMTFETVPTAGAYNHQQLLAQGTGVIAAENLGTSDWITVAAVPAASSPAGAMTALRVLIPDYANTGIYKTTVSESSEPTVFTTGGLFGRKMFGCWESTAAIDRIRLTLSTGNWTAASRMTIYGVPDEEPPTMTTKTVYDAATGETSEVPLEGDELAAHEAMLAEPDDALPAVIAYVSTRAVDAIARTTDDQPHEVFRFQTAPKHVYRATLGMTAIDAVSGATRDSEVRLVFKRAGASPSQVGSSVVLSNAQDTAAASWRILPTVDQTDLVISVAGAAGRTIDWSLNGSVRVFAPEGLAG